MTLKILGDPHLGRRFENNVPLHRRGEREQLVWAQFEQELDPKGHELHIMMGDLFDKAIVPYTVVLRAARLYQEAALSNPKTTFIVMRGNHDASRDLEAVSAFDVFRHLVRHVRNIEVVRSFYRHDAATIYGWVPVETADELVNRLPPTPGLPVFGHWDTDARYSGGNLIPTVSLAKLGVTQVFTGHIHKSDQFTRDGLTVVQTGSMQPYAHGEEVNDDLYVTLSLEDVKDKDADWLKDRCVRVLLEPGEVFDLEIDCLQLVLKRASDVGDDEGIEVSLGEFDLNTIYSEAMVGVPSTIETQVKAQWDQSFTRKL